MIYAIILINFIMSFGLMILSKYFDNKSKYIYKCYSQDITEIYILIVLILSTIITLVLQLGSPIKVPYEMILRVFVFLNSGGIIGGLLISILMGYALIQQRFNGDEDKNCDIYSILYVISSAISFSSLFASLIMASMSIVLFI